MKYWKSYPSAIPCRIRTAATIILLGFLGLTTISCSRPAVSNIEPNIETSPQSKTSPSVLPTNQTLPTSQGEYRAAIAPINQQVNQQTQSTTNKDFQPVKQSEATLASAKELIPNGWILEKETLGDLNNDDRADIALKLIQSSAAGGGARRRALLVLLSTPSGWQKFAFAPNLLLCLSCAGAMGTDNGAHIRVEINDGILVVYQLSGSREAVQTIHRFWIDRDSQELVCIGEDINLYDRVNGNKISDSRNFLTGKRIILESRGKLSRSQDPLRSSEMQVSKQLQNIESIYIAEIIQSAPSLPSD
jgi:hypothetical protein